MASEFEIKFNSMDYHFFFIAANPNRYASYMGIGLCVPKSLNVLKIHTIKLTDSKKWISTNPLLRSIISLLSNGVVHRPDFSHYSAAQGRYNFLLTAELSLSSGQQFVVSCIHMPCAYWAPLIMDMYIGLVCMETQQIAQDRPYLVAGDFNFGPEDDSYKLVTTGVLSSQSIARFESRVPADDTWRPQVSPLKSALKQYHGTEPSYTNFAQQSRDSEPFMGTLDYIFYSPHFQVLDASPIDRPDPPILCPNENEPSDHLLIWADFQLVQSASVV